MLTLISPAKINLFLQLLYKRADGYHELASLFQTISLHDTLTFQLSDLDNLTCNDPSIPQDDSNLILKAVNLFRAKTNLKFHIEIDLIKRIPNKAGLGGGSSNAATTLFALNELFNQPLSTQDLIALGSAIGSDVAFFFSSGTAYCTGRGEIIEELAPLPETHLTIVKSDAGLSTPLVFQNLTLSDFSRKDPRTTLNSFLTNSPDYYNDLEHASFRLLPALKIQKNNLISMGFDTVLMSGSGSAFFCTGHSNHLVNQRFTFNSEASFLNRNKKNWYENKKVLQLNSAFM